MANGQTYSMLRPDMFNNWNAMNSGFLSFLDKVIQGMGWFTKITSDYRDPTAQAGQIAAGHGAAEHSLHETGQAVDIRMPWTVQGVKLDWVKLGAMMDSIALWRRGIQVEVEIDITPNDVHIHIGWYGIPGPLLLEPTCRHAA